MRRVSVIAGGTTLKINSLQRRSTNHVAPITYDHSQHQFARKLITSTNHACMSADGKKKPCCDKRQSDNSDDEYQRTRHNAMVYDEKKRSSDSESGSESDNELVKKRDNAMANGSDDGESNKKKNNPCWDGYERVPGTKEFAPGSCRKL